VYTKLNIKKISFLGLSIALSILFTGCSVFNSGAATTSAVKKTSTQKVTRGNLIVGLQSDGRVNLSLYNLNFAVSGIVKAINVSVGQTVKAGDVLATLDDTDYKQALTTAQNNLSKAQLAYSDSVNQHAINLLNEQNKLNDALTKYNADPNNTDLKNAYSVEQLNYKNLVSNDTSVLNSKLSLDSAKSNVTDAQQNLAKVALTAPIAGVINVLSYKVGELVGSSTGSTSSSSTPFLVLCDPTVIYTNASVTEGDIVGVAAGQVESIEVDAIGQTSLAGKVIAVENTAKIDNSGIVSYNVKGQLDQPNAQIKDGMTCSVTFLKKEDKNVLLVPDTAIFIVDGKQYVNVQASDGKVVKTAITGGLSNGVQTEVTDGLTEGQTVVIGSTGSVVKQ
jgi:RND family efflux transporter MFP subunit